MGTLTAHIRRLSPHITIAQLAINYLRLTTPTVGLALGLMLLSTVLLASMHALVRYLGSDLHPFVIVFFRNLFGLIAVSPLLVHAGIRSLRSAQPGLHVLRACIGMCAMSFWFYALTKVPIANATALSFSTTIFASLSAWLFLGERMRFRRWAATVTGFMGVFVVLRPATDGFDFNTIYVLLSTIAWGLSLTIVKGLLRTESVTNIVGWMGISLTVLSLPLAIVYWQTPSHKQLLVLGAIGVLATAGHLMMTRALQIADTSVVMSVDFSRLIWTAIIGAFWFGEILDRWTVIGAMIIFSAGWYIIFRESSSPST